MSNDHLSDDRNPDAKHLVADAYKDGVYYFPGGVEITDAEAARIHPPIDDRFVELLAKHARILDELGDHLYDHLPDHHKDKGIAVQEAKAPYDKAHLESGAEGDVVYPDDVVALIEDYYEDTSSIDEMDPAVKRLGDEYIMALGEVEQALSHEYEFLLKGPKDSADRKIARIVGDRKFSALLGSIAAAGREVPIDAVSLEDAQESPSEEEHLSLIESEFEAMVADPQPHGFEVTPPRLHGDTHIDAPTQASDQDAPPGAEPTLPGAGAPPPSDAARVIKPAAIGADLTPGVLGVIAAPNCHSGASHYAFKVPEDNEALRMAVSCRLGDGTVGVVTGTARDPVYGFTVLFEDGGVDLLKSLTDAGLSGKLASDYRRPEAGQHRPVFFSMEDPILKGAYERGIESGVAPEALDGDPDSVESARSTPGGGSGGEPRSDGERAANAANKFVSAGGAAATPLTGLGGLLMRGGSALARAPGDVVRGIRKERYGQRVNGLYEAAQTLRESTDHALSQPEGSSERAEALVAVEQAAMALGLKHKAVADGVASVVGDKDLLAKASDALAVSRKSVEDTRDGLSKAHETESAEKIAQLIKRIMDVLMKLLRGISGKYSPPFLNAGKRAGETTTESNRAPSTADSEPVVVSPDAETADAAPASPSPRKSGASMRA